jgi:hypothetical protein
VHNPNDSEDNWEAANESGREIDNGIRDSETEEQRDVKTALNVPGLFRLAWRLKDKAEKVLMMVGTMETRKSKGIINK